MGGLDNALRHSWLAMIRESMGHAIRPAEVPAVHASGPLPYHVLLLGGGVAVGLGVTRRNRALPGHLARHLASISGRGVDVDINAWLGMTLQDARADLDRRDLSRYDAIMLTLGCADALARLSVEGWRAGLEALLVRLLNRTSPEAQTVVVGGEAVWSPYLNALLTRSAERRLDEFNRHSRELCWSLPRTSYLAPVTKRSSDITPYSVLDYDRVGRAAAAHLARRLVHQQGQAPSHSTAQDPPRLPSLATLGLLDLTTDALIDRVVARTRSAFGVAGAALTVLGPGAVGPQSVAGEQEPSRTADRPSLEAATAAERGGLAVRDLRLDPRFLHCPLARRRVAFYAGYPVWAPTGECVAVLTVFDPQPRTFSDQEMTVLRNHALVIQDALAEPVPIAPRTPARRESRPLTDNAPAAPTSVRARHA